jgi:hypothetical protein
MPKKNDINKKQITIEKQLEYYKSEVVKNHLKAKKEIMILNNKLEMYKIKIQQQIEKVKENERKYEEYCMNHILQRQEIIDSTH